MTERPRLIRLLSTFDTSTPVVTLFRVGANVRLIGPPVDGVAALLVIAGTLRLEVDGEAARVVPAGQLALVPAGRATRLLVERGAPATTMEGRECLVQRDGWLIVEATRGAPPGLVVAASRIAGSAAEGLAQSIVCPVGRAPGSRALFGLLRAEIQRGAQGQPSLASALMTGCVIQGLRHAIGGVADAPATVAEGRGLIARAIAAMRDRPAEPHTLDSLAQATGMSRSTFSRQFKRITRTTAAAYLQQVRLDEARSLLETTGLPVKAIASATGFVSRSHFSRSFRAAFGNDPTAYRHELRTGQSDNVPVKARIGASAGRNRRG